MLEGPNVLVLEDPTNHLDLESITSLNNGLINYKGNILFSSHDAELLSTVANRIIEIKPDGSIVNHYENYEDYMNRIDN